MHFQPRLKHTHPLLKHIRPFLKYIHPLRKYIQPRLKHINPLWKYIQPRQKFSLFGNSYSLEKMTSHVGLLEPVVKTLCLRVL